jgi:protein SCO1/2
MRFELRIGVGLLAAVLAASAHAGTATAKGTWPADSLHHVDVPMETSAGGSSSLAATGGHVRLATMFYASCPMACPLIIDTLRAIERELPAADRARLRVLLVTLDPERDTPAALRALAAQRRIDATRWTLARTAPSRTRELAAALGIQYRRLDDGNFNHSSSIVLLSADGRVLARTSTMGTPDPAFVAAVRAAVKGG